MRMLCLAWNSRLSRCWKRGCSSIWLTAGVTPVSPMIRSRWSWLKLETPIELMRPACLSSTSVFHASTYLSWLGTGQWIRNRSICSMPELAHRLVESLQSARSRWWPPLRSFEVMNSSLRGTLAVRIASPTPSSLS